MTPKIPISLPYVRQLVFGSATKVPDSVQNEIAQLMVDEVIMGYIRPMQGMPEYLQLDQGLFNFEVHCLDALYTIVHCLVTICDNLCRVL